MIKTLVEGFLLGISTGSLCLLTCSPIYLPYLISEDRKLSKGILAVLEISAGRFFSYLSFGAIAGYTGAQIAAVNRELYTSIAYILLSVYLILSAVRTRNKQRKCHIPKAALITKSAFVLGILTGINFCPSFLIAFSKAVDLGGAISGMLLFLGFFFGTSLYLIPLAFIGQISKLNKMKILAQIASVLIAIWFIFTGIKGINHVVKHHKLEAEPSRIVEAFNPNIPLVVIAAEKNNDYFKTLPDSLQKYTPQTVIFYHNSETITDSIDQFEQVVLVVDSSLDEAQFEKFDKFRIEPGYKLSKAVKYMKFYTFKTRTYLNWEFIEKK